MVILEQEQDTCTQKLEKFIEDRLYAFIPLGKDKIVYLVHGTTIRNCSNLKQDFVNCFKLSHNLNNGLYPTASIIALRLSLLVKEIDITIKFNYRD